MHFVVVVERTWFRFLVWWSDLETVRNEQVQQELAFIYLTRLSIPFHCLSTNSYRIPDVHSSLGCGDTNGTLNSSAEAGL